MVWGVIGQSSIRSRSRDLAIDNNASERALRKVVTGRKNWLWQVDPGKGINTTTAG
jgi:hypothetical protein